MHTAVRKRLIKPGLTEFLCEKCTIDCIPLGLQIYTPGRVSKYIRVLKNPGHLGITPTTTTTDIRLSNQMLSSAGDINVQIWFQDMDTPTLRKLTCPRVPVCELITCRVCWQFWINFSCYNTTHWIILSLLGIIIAGIILTGIYMVPTTMSISWYVSLPLRLCIRTLIRYRRAKASKIPRTMQDIDEESGTPLIDLPPNPYAPSSRGVRRSKNRLLHLLSIATCIMVPLVALSNACSDYSMMSAASTECQYTHDQERACQIRLNTRLVVSPLGQESCLHIKDSRLETLGTISIKTQSIVLRCKEELLYYVPRPSVK
ncbi:envelope glycoprotein [Folsomia candida]|uniref:Envelope glycoprotein n=1 Tax=Folsomia candida TaxID=158441 RepID=A0A226CXK7_FOLCA|nr:envelope glycoprotein [Folsomia candida]